MDVACRHSVFLNQIRERSRSSHQPHEDKRANQAQHRKGELPLAGLPDLIFCGSPFLSSSLLLLWADGWRRLLRRGAALDPRLVAPLLDLRELEDRPNGALSDASHRLLELAYPLLVLPSRLLLGPLLHRNLLAERTWGEAARPEEHPQPLQLAIDLRGHPELLRCHQPSQGLAIAPVALKLLSYLGAP